ncbi:uncharacterized protein V6R79_021473 [Siganus canaliculatus]
MSNPKRSLQLAGGHSLQNINSIGNPCELFRAECSKLISDTDKVCKRMQSDDSNLLNQRVKDIVFLKKELELKLEEIILEIANLVTLQSRVGKATEACKEPLRVTILCLEEREKRVPSARKHDEVAIELLKEREAIEEVAALLQRVAEQITEQIRLNQSAKYHLEKDLKEKAEAQCIDTSCTTMTSHAVGGRQRSTNSKTAVPSLTVSPKQWENTSDINIAKAEKQKNNSVSLSSLVESVLEQTASDMQKQLQATAAAFQHNIQNIKAAKSQMEDQLAKIVQELAELQRTREDLRVAIADTEKARSLAQARLDLRRQRPAGEQCHDPAQTQLLSEVTQLDVHIKRLREAVAQSEQQQRALIRCQLSLQENIDIKANCLYIDEVICCQSREAIVIHAF